MSVWNGSWRLAMHDLRKERWGFLLTIVFVFYMIIMTIPAFVDALETSESSVYIWITDFLNIAILPVLGFLVNRSMRSFWRNDYYTQKLAQWRTMPISLKQIVVGRLMQLLIVLTLAHLAFFTFAYIYIHLGSDVISLKTYILYALTWYAYSIVVAVTYVYWELGFPGFVYGLISFGYIIVYFLLTTGLVIGVKGSISVELVRAIEQGYWWIPVIAVLMAIMVLIVGASIVERRLGKRHFGK